MIAHGELGERPCALEAEHACADPPKRESDVVEIFTSINLIESTFVWERFGRGFSSFLVSLFADDVRIGLCGIDWDRVDRSRTDHTSGPNEDVSSRYGHVSSPARAEERWSADGICADKHPCMQITA